MQRLRISQECLSGLEDSHLQHPLGVASMMAYLQRGAAEYGRKCYARQGYWGGFLADAVLGLGH